MIRVLESTDGKGGAQVHVLCGSHTTGLIWSGPTKVDALIEAEKAIRDELTDVQHRLTVERTRLGQVKHSDARRG